MVGRASGKIDCEVSDTMAKVTGTAPPPSLAALFAAHVTVSNPYNQAADIARGDQELRGRKPWATSNALLLRARETADWLADKHAAGMSLIARRDYRAARVAEILAGNFPATWWNPVPMTGQNVQMVTPSSVAAPGLILPPWQDPARQASKMNYYVGVTDYAKPADYTDGATKSPGWFADVQSTVFADRWAAQLRFNFDINTPAAGVSRRPMWARIYTRHELSASFRGNRMWASANFSPTNTSNFGAADAVYHEWRGSISRANVRRLPLAAPATPWAQTVEQWHTVDLIWHTYLRRPATLDKFFLWAAPAVPNGKYFSRNDWCRCWFFCTPAVYVAKD